MLSPRIWLTVIHRQLFSSTPRPRRRHPDRRMFPVAAMERLESRQLLSGTATLNGTTLEIVGDNLANSVNVALVNPTTLDVNIDGAHSTFDPSLVNHITIDGLNGNDVLTIATSVTETAEINGGDGNDNMTAGAGDTTMTGGTGNDWYVFKNATSSTTDTVVELAGEGSDTLYLNAIADGVIVSLISDGSLATMTNRTVQTGAAGQATNFENAYGGAGNDILTGNAANNFLYGDGGVDRLESGGGNDLLEGGAGNDQLLGGAGNDTYVFNTSAAAGSDTITEASGIDSLNFNGSTNNLAVNIGLTTAQAVNANLTLAIDTSTSLENVYGGSGNDVLTGNSLNNALSGFGGTDSLFGGTGNDTLSGGDGSDALTGGDGNDKLIGDGGSDTMTGEGGNDVYTFADAVFGENDDVVEAANQGVDVLNFGAVTTTVMADLTSDFATAIMTNRFVRTGGVGQAANFENVNGGSAGDTLRGNAAQNQLVGGGGDDTLEGRGGGDTLNGGAGSDTMSGGTQNDVYVFENATTAEADTVSEQANQGIDTLSFAPMTQSVTVSLLDDVSMATMTNRTVSTNFGQSANFENIQGSQVADGLLGNAADNSINGLGGDDIINGVQGVDTLIGWTGDDTLQGGPDGDVYSFVTNQDLGSDTIVDHNEGLGVEDKLSFTGSNIGVTVNLNTHTPQVINANLTLTLDTGTTNMVQVDGGSGNDTLIGANAAFSRLDGKAGNDTLTAGDAGAGMTGGDGNDAMIGSNELDAYFFDNAPSDETDTITAPSDGTQSDSIHFDNMTDGVYANMSSTTTTLATMNHRTILTAVAGQGANFSVVYGGKGNDLIVGNALGNNLRGGFSGDDVIIGGGNSDAANGDGGNDLMLSDLTSYATDPVALAAIQAEWLSANSLSDKIGHLTGTLSGGLNGSFTLTQATVTDDGVQDAMSGDWVIHGAGDTSNVDPGGTDTLISMLPPS